MHSVSSYLRGLDGYAPEEHVALLPVQHVPRSQHSQNDNEHETARYSPPLDHMLHLTACNQPKDEPSRRRPCKPHGCESIQRWIQLTRMDVRRSRPTRRQPLSMHTHVEDLGGVDTQPGERVQVRPKREDGEEREGEDAKRERVAAAERVRRRGIDVHGGQRRVGRASVADEEQATLVRLARLVLQSTASYLVLGSLRASHSISLTLYSCHNHIAELQLNSTEFTTPSLPRSSLLLPRIPVRHGLGVDADDDIPVYRCGSLGLDGDGLDWCSLHDRSRSPWCSLGRSVRRGSIHDGRCWTRIRARDTQDLRKVLLIRRREVMDDEGSLLDEGEERRVVEGDRALRLSLREHTSSIGDGGHVIPLRCLALSHVVLLLLAVLGRVLGVLRLGGTGTRL